MIDKINPHILALDEIKWWRHKNATTNIAREISLGAGLPNSIPAHTCTLACISANQAITNAACAILAGHSQVAIAGGVETFSDADIRLTPKYRKFLLDLTMFKRPKTLTGKLSLLKGMSPKDFILPEKPAISECATRACHQSPVREHHRF